MDRVSLTGEALERLGGDYRQAYGHVLNCGAEWLLISFGILVAVFALVAITVPLISFDGGCCAPVSERETVQTAIDTMFVDNNMTRLTANGTAAKITNTTDFGGGQHITEYIRGLPTELCYTWTTLGTVPRADCP